MARMIQPTASTERKLNTVRRLVRICKQQLGGEELTQELLPHQENLKTKNTVVLNLAQAVEDAYDDEVFAESTMDLSVKNVHAGVLKYDREHLGEMLMPQLFPESKFSPITDAPRAKEPGLVEDLAKRIEALGSQHVLAPYAVELRQKAAQTRNCLQAHEDRIRALKQAEAEEEISAARLARAYEGCYLDARKKFGREIAEALFPRTTSSTSSQEEEAPVSAPAVN
jgi:hypothetical protein